MTPTPRAPESSSQLYTAETNPLPHVSSARAWNITLPKAMPVIREKVAVPRPPRRVRADGTEEICAEDIMVIVPRNKQPSSEALDDSDIVVEHAEPEFRPPAYSVHATQEILADDVLDVQNVQDDRPSSVPPPWTVDVPGLQRPGFAKSADPLDDNFDFPTAPQFSGQFSAQLPALNLITTYSATQVYRRRSANMMIVLGALSLAAAVVFVAGIARFAPSAGNSDTPVGISAHAPKKLDTSVRPKLVSYGKATQLDSAVSISIDALPSVPRWRRR